MYPFFPSVILFFSLLLLPLQTLAWQGTVGKVADGDTITVLHGTEQVRIRLYGIDTPEKKQAYGTAAKRFTLSRVAGKTVEVESVDTDRYGRTVGWVTAGSVSLNKELVRNGYAWVYKQYCRLSVCSELIRLEHQARHDRLGLWQEKYPVPPWQWRKQQRQSRQRQVRK
jgi:endonuclease YncB( thermonuclease family)